MPGKTDLTIVGLGNWGSSLAHACLAADIPLSEVVTRASRRLRLQVPQVTFENAAFDAKILWLCVRDAEIASVAERIVERRGSLRRQIVVHSSGALNVKALDAAKRAGAQVASIAPVMSFPTRIPVPLSGVFFAVEAGPEIHVSLNHLVRKLGGEPFAVESKKKPMYHAAATLASPLLVSEISAAMAAARLAGLSERHAKRWVESLAQASMRNVFARGEKNSFSGAFARGDLETIRLHLQTLQQHPILAEVYRSLARHAVETLPVKRRPELQSLLKMDALRKKSSRVRH
ncbi:Rossmann-like and DUF2520 domain-containing protein [Acidobacterium sp. S8]|uniref:Rossmann-like and DUF2520 domain-containing protein n=1 Tax=Acidobacterium sp. S8 TaxID=1641854 RepID=UPI00131AC165|nr:Rossmann-like and DUF2520 domain-containing protein [Acidobacterium sp. S8]